MTLPDTPDIARALGRFTDPEARAAAARLTVLHALGLTEARNVEAFRAERDAAIAERDARPTAEALAEAVAERDALRVRVAELTAPPSGPFAVPVVQFRAGLIGLRLALLGKSDGLRAKWGVILAELDRLTVVYPREQPVANLLDEAVKDEILTAAERAALRGE